MIKDVVNRILNDKLPVLTEVGKVVSVDSDSMTCEVSIIGKPNLTDVRLKSIINNDDNGILIKPKVGSYVLITLINNKRGNAFVSGYSDVDSIRLITPKIELGGDEFGGLIKIEELKQQLNTLTNRVDTIIKAIEQGVPVAGDGGIGYQTSMKLILATASVKENFDNIENKKVKHG